MPFFRVRQPGQVPIVIQHPGSLTATGYGDHPVNLIQPGEAELLFISYFDWNWMDYAELRRYHVSIARFGSHPELTGREALIGRAQATVPVTNL